LTWDLPSTAQTLAYASTVESHWDLGRFSFLRLKSYCEQRFYPIEILSEKIHPESKARPIWIEIKRRIKKGDVTLLIIPSLYHVAGSNLAKLSDFLRLLEIERVKLISLKDDVDTERFSRDQILNQFAASQFGQMSQSNSRSKEFSA
jgi:DNA invertase Pin-like site-specific DNA recombinase